MTHSDRPVHRSFAGGEQSPYMAARADLPRWKNSLETCENFVVLVSGAATRRPGTRDVYGAQTSSKLIPFRFSENDGYAVEFAPSPGKLHFFRDYGILNSAPNTPYEVSSPYTSDEVAALRSTQSADVMFLSCGTKPIYELERLGTTNWTLGAATFKNGPFMDPNLDQSFTLTTSQTGELTIGTDVPLSASAALFNAQHVGALFLIKVKDGGKHVLWQPGVGFSNGDIVVWDNNWYKCVQDNLGTKSGNEPPVHLYGDKWDGAAGVSSANARKWQYLHSGWGVVQIVSVTNSTTADSTAITYVPDDLESGTWQWAEGAWSDYRGYPRIVAIHKKRLYAFGTAAQPTTGWASVIDDYTNMDAQTTDADKAFAFTLEDGSGEVNIPQWVVSGNRLGVGTSGPEFVIGSSDATSPITPDSVDPESATSEGSASGVEAIKIDTPVFVSKDGRRIHISAFDFSVNDYVAPDLTIDADHVTTSGVAQLAWQREPYRLLWARRNDGDLACCTYRRDQDVRAWHRHTFAGDVQSIAVTPSPSGIRGDLWMIVERTLPGGTVRRVESLMPFFERGAIDVTNGWFLDGGFQYLGAPADIITGIPGCYIGATFRVLGDGQVRPDCVVQDNGGGTGKIVLDRNASNVICGVAMVATLTPLPYDKSIWTGDVIGGQFSGKKTRPTNSTLSVLNSAGVMVDAGDEDGAVLLRPAGSAPVDSAAQLFSGISEDIPTFRGWDDAVQITVTCSDPLPATILGIATNFQVAD